MNPLRIAARMLTGSTYLVLGVDAVRAPGARVEQAKSTLATVRKFAPLPRDDELIVRVNAGAQAAAGAVMTLGAFPRLSALVLAGSLIPTTWAGHAFWAIDDPVARKLQRVQLHKNVAMLGGLLFAALEGHGQVKTPRPRPTASGRRAHRTPRNILLGARRVS